MIASFQKTENQLSDHRVGRSPLTVWFAPFEVVSPGKAGQQETGQQQAAEESPGHHPPVLSWSDLLSYLLISRTGRERGVFKFNQTKVSFFFFLNTGKLDNNLQFEFI